MIKHKSECWQIGETSAPLPPMVDVQGMAGTAIQAYTKLYKEVGPVFRVRQGEQTVTILVGPEANVLVARYGHKLFVSREFWEDFGKALAGEQGMGLSNERDGEANRARRAKSSVHYSRAKVLDQIPFMVEIVREHAQTWPQGERFAMLPQMQRIVAEQLGQLLVHHEVGDYLQDFVTFLDTAIDNALLTKNFQVFFEPAFLRAKERTNELGRLILAKRRAEATTERKSDLLDHILADATEHPELYSEKQLERASVSPFLAGINTVAYTSCSMLYNLSRNQGAFTRVLAEVDDAFEQGPLDWARLKGMQAVHGAAMETLRLGNGQAVTDGQKFRVIKPLTFAGYRLEVGDIVQVAADVSHYLPELFPEPEVFDIDRYHAPRNEHRQPGAFTPFGLGDHICLGSGIAEIQLMVNIATTLRFYEIEVDAVNGQQTTSFTTFSPGIKQLGMQVVARQ